MTSRRTRACASASGRAIGRLDQVIAAIDKDVSEQTTDLIARSVRTGVANLEGYKGEDSIARR